MDTSLFDSQITSALAETKNTQSLMASRRQVLKAQTASYLAAWFKTTIERAITDQPGVSKNLGLPGLKKLKAELASLTAKIPDLTEERFGNMKLWPLEGEWPQTARGDSQAYFELRRAAHEAVRSLVRDLVGPCGPLLMQAGFDGGSWEKSQSGLPKYKFGLTWTTEMEATWKSYEELSLAILTQYEAIRKAETEREKAEAKDLWNKA